MKPWMHRLAAQCTDTEYEVFMKAFANPPDTLQSYPHPGPYVPKGRKDDTAKPRWDLLPYDALGSVVDVLTHGAEKYSPENWRHVEDWHRRYFAAAQRHLVAYFQGDQEDDESGLPHLAHAACCVLFLLAKDMEDD